MTCWKLVATVPPAFAGVASQPDGSFSFTGTGAAGQEYQLFATTNLLPPAAWVLVTSATANVSGVFQLSDLQATNFPQRFYRIQSP